MGNRLRNKFKNMPIVFYILQIVSYAFGLVISFCALISCKMIEMLFFVFCFIIALFVTFQKAYRYINVMKVKRGEFMPDEMFDYSPTSQDKAYGIVRSPKRQQETSFECDEESDYEE